VIPTKAVTNSRKRSCPSLANIDDDDWTSNVVQRNLHLMHKQSFLEVQDTYLMLVLPNAHSNHSLSIKCPGFWLVFLGDMQGQPSKGALLIHNVLGLSGFV